ncbi:MAG: porin family protein [Pyrinomonadaceae bacterium]|nr:porin family protein [Pyrinomonadaceae bacterium]
MRKLLFSMLLIVCCAGIGFAQNDDDSRAEFFIGYSNLQFDTTLSQEDFDGIDEDFDSSFFDDRVSLNGVNASVTGYFTRRFGITGDFSYHQRSDNENIEGTNFEARTRVLNFLAGPQVKFRNASRVEPFVRAMAGVTNTRVRFSSDFDGSEVGFVPDDFTDSQTNFALGLGGGLDVRVNDRVSIRAFQVDYNPVFLRNRDIDFGSGVSETFEGRRLDNVRFSFGVVFK